MVGIRVALMCAAGGAALGSMLVVGAALADTIGDVLRSRGLNPPPEIAALADAVVGMPTVLDDAGDVLVVYETSGDPARLRAVRFAKAPGVWTSALVDWTVSPLPMEACGGGRAVSRFAAGFLVTAHINPSAECTVVLGPDLGIRAVLAGWPVASFADGRIVYQRNQVHFAAVHPVALALFNPRGPAEVDLYPPRPSPPLRAAHVARMRQVYTEGWCRTRNHPCDPQVFDESVTEEVAVDSGGDALALAVAWDNTAGWSDTERWGRLEPFREVRQALAAWDGRGEPPADLHRALASGLGRTRNLGREPDVRAALSSEPQIGGLIAAALATSPPPGLEPRARLVALDARWADAATWRALARAVAVPDELTEVVYVYTGLRRPGAIAHRELLRRDLQACFGGTSLRGALEPDVLRQLFGSASSPANTR